VALVDVVFALGINPDGIVGHSVGELGCGYADGSCYSFSKCKQNKGFLYRLSSAVLEMKKIVRLLPIQQY
jgi:malonyl CoA-acyl carrier protein transacylase